MAISIGTLSERTGVKVPTIRYYEQQGLMPTPLRTEGRQRRYGEDEVSRLSFIRRARELGFEIDAIRDLLGMAMRPNQSCEEVDTIARHHLAEVESRLARLSALRTELTRMLDECGHGRVGDCRIIEALNEPGVSV